jgi:hypothetical protein
MERHGPIGSRRSCVSGGLLRHDACAARRRSVFGSAGCSGAGADGDVDCANFRNTLGACIRARSRLQQVEQQLRNSGSSYDQQIAYRSIGLFICRRTS